MKTSRKSILLALGLPVLLTGCAVYEPVPYAQMPVYQTVPAQPVYVRPAPVYVQPAPVYVTPPVNFGFSFGYWGGRDGRGRHGGPRGHHR